MAGDDKKKKDCEKKADDEDDAYKKCLKKGNRNYYRYYDSPDGCNVDKKIMATTRYGVVAGLILGTYDVLMFSHDVGLGPILKRYARHVLPLGLMGATFAAVANGVQHFRNIDDHLNYFAGGAACGPLVALYTRSGHGLVAGGLALGIMAVLKKEAIETNFLFFPDLPRPMNMIDTWRHDWTLIRDPRDDMFHTCDEDEDEDDKKKKDKKKKDQKKKKEQEKREKEKKGKKEGKAGKKDGKAEKCTPE